MTSSALDGAGVRCQHQHGHLDHPDRSADHRCPNLPGIVIVIPLEPGRQLARDDSDASGTSVDIYTIQIFPLVGLPVPHTFVANRSEANPSWAPDGVRVVYDTNKYGPLALEIVNTLTNAVTLAETNFAAVTHSNPDFSSDGNSIYYDAPAAEDPLGIQNIWKLHVPTQTKCEKVRRRW